MGMRFRKSFGKGPFRMTVSKSGIGASVGAKGARITKKAGSGTRSSVSVPGTGISYVKDSSKKKGGKYSATSANSSTSSATGAASALLYLISLVCFIPMIVIGLILLLVAPIWGAIGIGAGLLELRYVLKYNKRAAANNRKK